eukprot:10478431-Ditylum_brightwellii.AAC.1
MDETSCIKHGANNNENDVKVVSTKLNDRESCASVKSFSSCFSATTDEAKLKENKCCLARVQQKSAKYIHKMKKKFYVEMQADFNCQIAKIILAANMSNKKLQYV